MKLKENLVTSSNIRTILLCKKKYNLYITETVLNSVDTYSNINRRPFAFFYSRVVKFLCLGRPQPYGFSTVLLCYNESHCHYDCNDDDDKWTAGGRPRARHAARRGREAHLLVGGNAASCHSTLHYIGATRR